MIGRLARWLDRHKWRKLETRLQALHGDASNVLLDAGRACNLDAFGLAMLYLDKLAIEANKPQAQSKPAPAVMPLARVALPLPQAQPQPANKPAPAAVPLAPPARVPYAPQALPKPAPLPQAKPAKAPKPKRAQPSPMLDLLSDTLASLGLPKSEAVSRAKIALKAYPDSTDLTHLVGVALENS